MSKTDTGLCEIGKVIDQLIDPSKMSLQEAVDFLEALREDVLTRLDALHQDIENAEAEALADDEE